MEYFKDCMNIEALEKEHRRLVIKMHPDRNPDNPDATAEFQEMQSQYEERKDELNGDYRKSARGRERREREARERREREARENGRRKVEQAIRQARLNIQKPHTEWRKGDYVYARGVQWMRAFSADEGCVNDVLRMAVKQGMKDETVVFIEVVFDISDKELMDAYLSYATDGEIYGGWETLQEADPANGVPRAKRVAKVVMFRSEHYCIFGNPKGDQVITDYYLPVNYETMFSDHLHRIKASIEREQQEAARIEAERRAKIEAEQRPLIEEWKDKLIAVSAGLTESEQRTVAAENLKRMLKAKFPGVRFSVKTSRYGETSMTWEDGPKLDDVRNVTELFRDLGTLSEPTPWMEQFGSLRFPLYCSNRKMSVLTKARILQDLGQVTEAFCEGAMSDDVDVSDWDWQMLHALCGVDIYNPDASLCLCTLHADGRRTLNIADAVRYVFSHTSYVKPKKVKRQETVA